MGKTALLLVACLFLQACFSQSPKPGQVDPELDCGLKKLAYQYALHLRPGSTHVSVFDALELHTRCSVTRPPDIRSPKPRFVADQGYYVDYNKGSDANAGTIDAPFKTIVRAVGAVHGRPTGPRNIYLREGTHFLSDTIYLTSQDYGLTFIAYDWENVTINGGIPLKTSWKQYNGNVYVTNLAGQNVKDVLGLQLNGNRCVRARYPNANPETDLSPKGWITSGYKYQPHKPVAEPHVLINRTLVRTEGGNWQYWKTGVGGGCAIYDPPEGFWCAQQGNYYTPSGIDFTAAAVPRQWVNAEGGIVHAWRDGHWNTFMFEIDSYNATATDRSLGWSYGGFQGSRPTDTGNEWYVDNIFEELDAPNEFFYDKRRQLLYYYVNGTGAPPETGFVATNLKVLVNITGVRANPVRVVSFIGLTFQNAAPTYMDPHGAPSGGDWGLQKTGAVYLEWTYGTVFSNCTFTRLDGNAVFLSGYNAYTNFAFNEFLWIGDSCIAAWGNSNQIDATAHEVPSGTQLVGNIFHEFGHYQKQSSAWFQALSDRSYIVRNIIFNGPRAGINFNDGFGGDNEITENLIFNQCRESGDHGPFNSWDRIPYYFPLPNGTASLVPLYNEIHHNFFIANYDSSWSIDNDDGSSWYDNHHNVMLYSQGSKSYAQGHNKYDHDNLYYCTGTCFYFWDMYTYPNNDRFYQNRVIQNYTGPYGDLEFGDPKQMVESWSNLIHRPTSGVAPQFMIHQNKTVITWPEWQRLGKDNGTIVYNFPAYHQIYTWVQDLLAF